LILSLALHLALLPLLWRKPFSNPRFFEPIPVSFLPEPIVVSERKAQTAPPLRSRLTREVARAKQLRRAPLAEKKVVAPEPRAQPQTVDMPVSAESPPSLEQTSRPAVEPPPQMNQASATPEPAQGEASIFRNDAPEKSITQGDLLPRRRDLVGNYRAIPLNTTDARYAPYTQTVKQWIEARWEYPDLAKHYGLQGRVVVEFTILQNGHIELLALVRSSGSKLLDEEAVRAIKAAVPFKPFPRSIQETSLRIIAGFIYSDQRLRVSDMQ
jgi:TonB family protein